jgi:hypothetical protein
VTPTKGEWASGKSRRDLEFSLDRRTASPAQILPNAPVECNELLNLASVAEFNTVMDPTQIRTRYLVFILLSALITAGVLRHVLHTNIGFSRWEILEGALTCLALTAFLGLTLRLLRRD